MGETVISNLPYREVMSWVKRMDELTAKGFTKKELIALGDEIKKRYGITTDRIVLNWLQGNIDAAIAQQEAEHMASLPETRSYESFSVEITCEIKLDYETQVQRILDALEAKVVDEQVHFHDHSIDCDEFGAIVSKFISECVDVSGLSIDEEIGAICASVGSPFEDSEINCLIECLTEKANS